MPRGPVLESTFPASALGARRARRELTHAVQAQFFQADLCDFEAAIGEALAASVLDGESALRVACWEEDDAVIAEIERGTPLARRGSASLDERRTRSYALRLMRALADDVVILDGGRRIRLRKRRSR